MQRIGTTALRAEIEVLERQLAMLELQAAMLPAEQRAALVAIKRRVAKLHEICTAPPPH